MSENELRTVLLRCRELGTSLVALRIDRPLIGPRLMQVVGEFSEIQFLLRAEPSAVDEVLLAELEHVRNVTPVIAVDGLEKGTDLSPKEGEYARIVQLLDVMRARRLFFGVSLGITRGSYALMTSRMFVRHLVQRGCRLFFFKDYVPQAVETEHLAPSASQKKNELLSSMLLSREFPALFVATSAFEARFGADLVAGTCSVHVGTEGVAGPGVHSRLDSERARELPAPVPETQAA